MKPSSRKIHGFLFHLVVAIFLFLVPFRAAGGPVTGGSASAGSPTGTIVPAKTEIIGLIKGLMNPKSARSAFDSLAGMGKSALPSIKEMLAGKNVRLLRAAMDLAEKWGSTDEMRQELLNILTSRRFGGLRVRAAKLLGKVSVDWGKSLPGLLKTLKDPNVKLRLAVAESLVQILSSKGKLLPELAKQLGDPASPLRKMAVEGLSGLGQYAHPLLPLAVSYFQKGRVEPSEVLVAFVPKVLPGATGWAKMVLDSSALFGEANEHIGPDSEALDLPDIEAVEEEANQADAALSFEDIPAQE